MLGFRGQKGPYGMYNICIYLLTWTAPTFLQVEYFGLNLLLISCRCVLRSLKFRNFGFALGSKYKRSKRTICCMSYTCMMCVCSIWLLCVGFDFVLSHLWHSRWNPDKQVTLSVALIGIINIYVKPYNIKVFHMYTQNFCDWSMFVKIQLQYNLWPRWSLPQTWAKFINLSCDCIRRDWYGRLFMPLEVQLSKKRESWDPINRLNTTTLYTCPRQDLDLQCHMSWSCLCLGQRCFFILLILVELLTITVETIFS